MHRRLTFLVCYRNLVISTPFIRQLSLSSFPPNSPGLVSPCSDGKLREALVEMTVQGLEMKFEGYYTLLNECVSKRALREGQRVHAHMIKTCYLPPVHLRTRLIVFYNNCDCLDDARRVLDEMPLRNVVSWTAMISAYSKRGYASQATNVFLQMLRSGIVGFCFVYIHGSIILLCLVSKAGRRSCYLFSIMFYSMNSH